MKTADKDGHVSYQSEHRVTNHDDATPLKYYNFKLHF